MEFVETIKAPFLEIFRILTGDRLTLSLAYRSCCGDDPDEAGLLRLLEERADREAAAGTCLVGPHRADIDFLWFERPYKDHASLGQSRIVGLVLKCVQVAAIMEVFDDPPVVLLDDVLLELDAKHRERFRRFFTERFGKAQTIEAATTMLMFDDAEDRHVIELDK